MTARCAWTIAALWWSWAACGCATLPTMSVEADRYRIEVHLDPAAHRLVGRTTLDLIRTDTASLPPGRPVELAFLLHPNLTVTRVETGGVSSRYSGAPPPRDAGQEAGTPRRHLVILDEPVPALSLFVEYYGELFDDVAAGGQSGHIHGALVRAHVSEEGVFLGGGYWYPQPQMGEKDTPALADFTLIAESIPGFPLVAGAERVSGEAASVVGAVDGASHKATVPATSRERKRADHVDRASHKATVPTRPADRQVARRGHAPHEGPRRRLEQRFAETALSQLYAPQRSIWRTPFPVEQMVLVGGPNEVHLDKHNDVLIALHLSPALSDHAPGLMAAVLRSFTRYEPLIGPYPAREFTIVSNFFHTGFAFPTLTVLSPDVIQMGERLWTAPGYLDHELLHCWWGNGVHVDPRDGNWCESLAGYAANYYGHTFTQRPDEARRKRRNDCHFLSRVPADLDRPLGTFTRPGGCSRAVAEKKGAMVFHMLAENIGQENFWSAMRRFNETFLGEYARWDDLRRICEETANRRLDAFFQQWVYSPGAPQLEIESARFDAATGALTIILSQGAAAFDLPVPLRMTHAEGFTDVIVQLHRPRAEIAVTLDVEPLSVEVDPDYHVFRTVSRHHIIPTTASTRSGGALACVVSHGELPRPYVAVRALFESAFDEAQTLRRVAGAIEPGALAERCTLILGDAVHDPYVSAFLAAAEFPVRFGVGGFVFDDTAYNDPAHAVLCTVRHPGVEGGGITVAYANRPEALPSPADLLTYDRSLVIFANRSPIVERDFEIRNVVEIEQTN